MQIRGDSVFLCLGQGRLSCLYLVLFVKSICLTHNVPGLGYLRRQVDQKNNLILNHFDPVVLYYYSPESVSTPLT